jgi:hypothetical protein
LGGARVVVLKPVLGYGASGRNNGRDPHAVRLDPMTCLGFRLAAARQGRQLVQLVADSARHT